MPQPTITFQYIYCRLHAVYYSTLQYIAVHWFKGFISLHYYCRHV